MQWWLTTDIVNTSWARNI